jgi:hypothetical protein
MTKERILSIFKRVIPGYNEEEYEIWKTMTYDLVPLNYPTTCLFVDDEINNFKTITEFTEREILDFLFSRNDLNPLLLDAVGIPTSGFKLFRELTRPLVMNRNEKPGDLDLILFDVNSIQKAIGIEVKCVKAKTFEDGRIKLTKEKNITKGISQANEYLKFGFHKTFLLMILLDDGQYNTKHNQFFRDTDLRLSKKLFNRRILKNLHPDIGLIYLKVNQITGKSIFQSGKISVCVEKNSVEKKSK